MSRIRRGFDFAFLSHVHARHPQHLPDFSYVVAYRYALRFCTHERRKHFTSAAVVDLVRLQIRRFADDEAFAVRAYCFMPDHLHLLIEGLASTSNGKRFIARAKQYSGFCFTRAFRERLWQRYGFDRVLRDDEDSVVEARYILENPIRAGLAVTVREYPFMGSLTHTVPELLDDIRRA